MPIAEIEDGELRRRFNNHCVEYERRHGELEGRVKVLEQAVANLATRTDLEKLKVDIVQGLAGTVATSTDIDWLKKAFWWGLGILSALIVGGTMHVFGKI